MYDYQFLKRLIPFMNIWLFSFAVVAPLGLAGMLLVLLRTRRLNLLTLVIVSCNLSLLPFAVLGRLRMGMIPMLVIFAAWSIREGYRLIIISDKKRLTTAVLILLTTSILVNWPLKFRTAKAAAASYTNLGLIHLQTQNPLKAIDTFYLAVNSDHTYINALDSLLAMQSNPAINSTPKLKAQLNKTFQRVAETVVTAADESMKAGDYIEALNSYNNSLRFKLDNFAAFYGGAEASFQLQEYPRALLYLKKTRELKPNSRKVKQLHAEISKIMKTSNN